MKRAKQIAKVNVFRDIAAKAKTDASVETTFARKDEREATRVASSKLDAVKAQARAMMDTATRERDEQIKDEQAEYDQAQATTDKAAATECQTRNANQKTLQKAQDEAHRQVLEATADVRWPIHEHRA